MNFEEFRRKIVLFFEGKDEELEEETPTMSVSGGGIAGVSDNNPPAPLKKPRRLSPEELEKMLGKGIKSFKVSKEEYEKFSDRAKRKNERWNKFFEDGSESGEAIKKYSMRNPSKPIIIQNEDGEAMILRRPMGDKRLMHHVRAKKMAEKKYGPWSRYMREKNVSKDFKKKS